MLASAWHVEPFRGIGTLHHVQGPIMQCRRRDCATDVSHCIQAFKCAQARSGGGHGSPTPLCNSERTAEAPAVSHLRRTQGSTGDCQLTAVSVQLTVLNSPKNNAKNYL